MRKELEFPGFDESKIAYVSQLIDFIAENGEADYQNELLELNHITGKNYKGIEFAEYWGWTSLDIISRKALTPNPPFIKDLSKNEIIEIISIIKNHLKNCEDVEFEYYTELLHRSLPLSDILQYVMINAEPEEIADKILEDSKESVIYL
ncbi:hypothetical protein SAMN02745163_01339 [Clostridium cavendishii DSM 21758]|uniref:Uncharacterized protein n=1 Tax=Clostridium cavendishii DSM 21758 TaxID=1121302 RepID=A0A1M6GNV2_9CLOT|nr:hypothetical protein [Clostridium cavendishii]SHJ11647.1 hypothetical protein SAMN02745163_01339 [Clostridium cavendishii DSM 21758]